MSVYNLVRVLVNERVRHIICAEVHPLWPTLAADDGTRASRRLAVRPITVKR